MPSKLFAIGDIHGCHNKLMLLLDRLPFDKKADTLVFLGDYINRGPDSRKVLDTLLRLARECDHVVFLKGNHEHALLEYALTGEMEDLGLFRAMGVEATAASYGAPLRHLLDLSCLPTEHLQFLQSLRYCHTAGGYLFVHANPAQPPPPLPTPGTMAEMARQRHEEAILLASRRLAQETLPLSGPVVVFGHLPFATPLVKLDRIGIDTGAVYGNLLTAVQLPDLLFYHA